MSEQLSFQVEYTLSDHELNMPARLDICDRCENGQLKKCIILPFCAHARRMMLELLAADIKGQSTPPRKYNADWQSGYQMGILMAQNAIYDRLSGKLQEVLERAQHAVEAKAAGE
jgi:hypothetical protein